MRITSNKATSSSIVAKFEVSVPGTISHSPGLFELIKSVTYTDNKSFPRLNRLTVGIESIYEKTLHYVKQAVFMVNQILTFKIPVPLLLSF